MELHIFKYLPAPALLLLLNQPAIAVVNMEKLRGTGFQPGFSATAEGTFSSSSGNVESFDVGAVGTAQYQSRRKVSPSAITAPDAPETFQDQVLLLFDTRFAEIGGTPFVNQFFSHLRWTHLVEEWWGAEVYSQYQFNQFIRLNSRVVLGGGGRIEMVRKPWMRLWVGSGYLAEYEQLSLDAADGSHQPFMTNHRWSNYMVVRAPLIADRMSIQNTLYFQPMFSDFGDIRMLNQLEFDVSVTEMLSILFTVEWVHDTKPPLGVRATDTRIRNSIRFAF